MEMATAKVSLSRREVQFLRRVDTCRIATVDSRGYPHCVPVGYFYHGGTIYVPTVARTKKARNIEHNPRCCVVVDVVERGRGRGLMIQGKAKLLKGASFTKSKRLIEELSGWRLDTWRINGSRPDSVLMLAPEKIVEIGRV